MGDKKLNIVLYVNSFLPTIGGKQFVVYYLADALHKLGHNVRVVGPGGKLTSKQYIFSFPVHRFTDFRTGKLDWKAGRFYWLNILREEIRYWALKINVSRCGCDVIHAHTTYPNGYIAVKLGQIKNIPVVITPHGADIRAVPELGYGLMLRPEIKKRIGYSLRGASALTAISKNIFTDLLKANASKDKIYMIPNGVDMERFASREDVDVNDWLGVPKNAKLIVTIGQYHSRKGHDILIKAMSSIVKQENRALLIFIGKSDESLKLLTRELNLEDYVIFTGEIQPPILILANQNSNKHANQEEDLLAVILNNSKLYVSAGIHESSEGLSLAVLEAMASSLPVVASDISGNRDVVIEGKNGLLVTPGSVKEMSQAILKILSDKEMRQKMSVNARNYVSRYDWQEIAKQYESVYRNTQ